MAYAQGCLFIVISHSFEQFSLGELKILSLREQRSLLVVAICLFQDCSIDFPFTIDRLSLWKSALSHKSLAIAYKERSRCFVVKKRSLLAMTKKENG